MEMAYATVHCHPHARSAERGPARCICSGQHCSTITSGSVSPTGWPWTQDRTIGILAGSPATPNDHPLLHKVAQLRDLCLPLTPPGWFDRHISSIGHYLYKGLKAESALRRHCRIPTFAELEQFRPYAIVQVPYQRMVEIEIDLDLPEEVITHPVVASAEHVVARLAAWQDDALSLLNELARPTEVGDVMNLALVLQHRRGCSLEDACIAVLEVFKADVDDLLRMSDNLPDFGVHQKTVRDYVRHLMSTFSGLVPGTWRTAALVTCLPASGSTSALPDARPGVSVLARVQTGCALISGQAKPLPPGRYRGVSRR